MDMSHINGNLKIEEPQACENLTSLHVTQPQFQVHTGQFESYRSNLPSGRGYDVFSIFFSLINVPHD